MKKLWPVLGGAHNLIGVSKQSGSTCVLFINHLNTSYAEMNPAAGADPVKIEGEVSFDRMYIGMLAVIQELIKLFTQTLESPQTLT